MNSFYNPSSVNLKRIWSSVGSLQKQVTALVLVGGGGGTATDAQLRDRSTHTNSQPSSTISDFNTVTGTSTLAAINLKQNLLGYTPLNKAGDVITGDIGNVSTGFIRISTGTTAQRPASPLDGMRRYNLTTLRDEFYANGAWQNHARLAGDTFTGTITAPTFIGALTGNATTVTTNANLTGEVTSVGNVTTIAPNVVINADLAQMATKTYKGRTSTLTGNAEDVLVSILKTDLLLVKSDVGLSNVDNTSDATKPVSTAQTNALNLKVDKVTGKSLIDDTEITRLLTVSTNPLIFAKNTEQTVTGTLVETTVFTQVIPGNSMGINGSIDILCLASVNNNANAKSINIKINGVSVFNTSMLNTVSFRGYIGVNNKGVTNAQVSGSNGSIGVGAGFGFFSSGTPSQFTLDTTLPLTVTITLQTPVINTDIIKLHVVKILVYKAD